ncbi:MBL fold metallo-hydrolase [Miniphocaeibacter halophilus]|uniref:MBL fold metallo-hydrolase n=1 Tax=Miniphocaeibacter halophilus TaxID=2931922 RepID=A0AC61MT75_9FIRM|nr:MBL fold metallo-hydrolase [Miniphocaeibacter halophilus]QQK07800.1 MBL fold metallo-hydrolase [Miniphocaeibacter halophilus]
MEIIKYVTRSLVENVYIVVENENCFIIDPGYDFNGIKNILEERNLKPKFIILTHGHADHIGSVEELKKLYNIPIYAHIEEKDLLNSPELNLSSQMYGDISLEADHYVKEGDIINFENNELKIIHTPGHTQGGMCILMDGHIFTGDTIFAGSVGRTDLPTSNFEELKKSLNKLMLLDDDLIIHPGHNSDSTIGRERISNPFIS